MPFVAAFRFSSGMARRRILQRPDAQSLILLAILRVGSAGKRLHCRSHSAQQSARTTCESKPPDSELENSSPRLRLTFSARACSLRVFNVHSPLLTQVHKLQYELRIVTLLSSASSTSQFQAIVFVKP